MEILRSLEGSPVVRSWQVLDFKALEDGRYFKIRVELADASVLHAREYSSKKGRNYSYHWQNAQHNLRIRWDNAPHYERLPTHPHHRHEGTDVLPNEEITFPEVMAYIEARLSGEK